MTITGKTLSKTYNSGIILLDCNTTLKSCDFPVDQPLINSGSTVNTLILFTKTTYKVYMSVDDNTYESGGAKIIYASGMDPAITLAGITGLVFGTAGIIDVPSNRLSGVHYRTQVAFSGSTPDSAGSPKEQSYVKFTVNSKTINYDNAPASSRAESTIQTTVAARSYK